VEFNEYLIELALKRGAWGYVVWGAWREKVCYATWCV